MKWISVEDRLPTEKQYVLCYLTYDDYALHKFKPRVKTGWLKYAAGEATKKHANGS